MIWKALSAEFSHRRNLRIAPEYFQTLRCELVSGMDCAQNRDGHDQEHHHHIDAQSPKQEPRSSRKALPSEMGSAFGGNDLIGFEQRQNRARIGERRLVSNSP